MIIITSTLDIEKFFNNVFQEQPETVVQLKRRCQLYMRMSAYYIKTFLYNETKRVYEEIGDIPNMVLSEHQKKVMSQEEKIKKAKEILGKTGDMLKNLSNKIDVDQMTLDDYKDVPFS